MENSEKSTKEIASAAGTALLKISLEARASEADAAAFDQERSSVNLLKAGQEMKSISFQPENFSTVTAQVLQLAACWPNFDDPFFIAQPGRTRRLLTLLSGGAQCLIELPQLKRRQTESQQIFEKISFAEGPALLDRLDLVPFDKAKLTGALAKPSGIILADGASEPESINARAVVLATRPDALLVKHGNLTAADGSAIAELAKSHLVVVEIDGTDPVDLSLQFLGLFRNETAAIHTSLADLLLLSFIHRRTKRSCAACARTTVIDPLTLARLPEQLRPKDESYLFGRGCDRCGHSAYLGSIGLESVLEATDEFKELLKRRANADELALSAYRNGTRTLLENGLQKLFGGLTSFESIFAVTDKVSAAFAAAIENSSKESTKKTEARADSDELFPSAKRLLIVEDDPDQRGILEMVFKTAGYHVLSAGSGAEALKKLESERCDLVICDLMMPGMSGEQLVKELRAKERTKNLPVLVLTAVQSADVEYAMLSHGVDEYCEKNVKRKVLLKRVENLLARTSR